MQIKITIPTIVLLSLSSTTLVVEGSRSTNQLRGVGLPQQTSDKTWSNDDMMKLFKILNTAEDYILGSASSGSAQFTNPDGNPTDFNGFLPHNVQSCTDVLTNQTAFGPHELTGYTADDSEFNPDLLIPGRVYEDLNYDSESFYGKAMNQTVSRLSHVLEQLHEEGFVNVVGDDHPMLMFDIDNTISYSAFNDTDNTGQVKPIRETVQFVHQWCKGWGDSSEPTAIFDCFFITARWCSEGTATNTETFMRRNFPAASSELIDSNVMLTGAITLKCQEQLHQTYKDILRCKLEDKTGGKFVASIGDQYTDSAGACSGLKVKLPNVWFDSSIVQNNQQYKPYATTQLPEAECSTERAFGPTISTSESCVTDEAREKAMEFSTLAFCKSLSVANGVENQQWGCQKEISNQPAYPHHNGTDPFTCCMNKDERDQDNLSCY